MDYYDDAARCTLCPHALRPRPDVPALDSAAIAERKAEWDSRVGTP